MEAQNLQHAAFPNLLIRTTLECFRSIKRM
jgi:hypothetical protein